MKASTARPRTPLTEFGPAAVIRRSEMLAAGYSDNDIRRLRETRILRSVAPGLYSRGEAEQELDVAARHRAAVDAVVPGLIGNPVVSHISAAIVHGLPFTHSEMPPVHVIRGGPAKSRRSAGVHVHRSVGVPPDVVLAGGLAVTSVARTVLDCARILPFEHAVMLADAAIHRGLVTKADLDRQLALHSRIPGIRLVADVLSFADGRSASAGESHTRVVLRRAGLPVPELQMPVFDERNTSLGAADFGFPAARVIGEFDGYVRYGRLLHGSGFTAEPPPEVVRQEMDRERLIKQAGWQVIRWTWPDLDAPAELAEKFRAAIAVGAGHHTSDRQRVDRRSTDRQSTSAGAK